MTHPSPKAGPDNLRGGAWMLFSVFTASAMTLAARLLAEDLDSRMIVFLRSAATLIALAPLLAWPRARSALRFSRPWMHLLRGALIGVSTNLGFFAIAELPLATATVLFFTAPIFATLLAGPVNGESVGPRRWAAVFAGFAGALIILRPGLSAFEPAMLAALGSSLLFALALSLSRGLAMADGAPATFLSSVVITGLVTLPLAVPVWALPPDGPAWAALALLVIAGASRGVGDIQAYRLGEASVMGVIAYLRLVLIGTAAWILFEELPDAATWAGGVVIVGATLYIAHREAVLRRAGRGPKAGPAD